MIWLWVVFAGLHSRVFLCPCTASEYPVDRWKAWHTHASRHHPGESWTRFATPEEAGWSNQKLAEARQYFEEIDSTAVMAIYDGAVLAAWGDVQRRYMCHSIRKSLLSALYGIHVAEGNIDLDRTLAELGIDDEPPLIDAEKKARVADLLASRSGVYHPAAYETNKMKEKRPERGSHRPGEFFYYNNWDFNALCTIFEQETGTRVFEEFQKRFATALGMQDFRLQDTYYHLERKHSIHPAYPFRMSTRDMARFGLLFLRQGKWKNSRILTEQWVIKSTASHFGRSDTASNDYGYGYLWWRKIDGPFRDLDMYSARGYGGHSIDVVPAADLVFVHRVDTFWDMKLFDDRERTRVQDAERLNLLNLVLNARDGPPKANPKVIPLARSQERNDVVELDPDFLSRYEGEYQFEKVRTRVKRVGEHLLIGGPEMSDFSLLPQSETRFVIEDVEAPVLFELDRDGNPTWMTVEVTPAKRCLGARVVR